MKKIRYHILALLCFCIIIFGIGCTKGEIKKENIDNEIEIKNNCENLTTQKADVVAKEIKDIMIDSQKVRTRLENFTMTFANERKVNGKILIDITVEADWTTFRKPEDDPIIIGMYEVLDTLKTKEEKEGAEVAIRGYIGEMEHDYNKTERLPEYLRLRIENKTDLNYEILVPEDLDSDLDTNLFPMKEYFDDNYKEIKEERKEIGKSALLNSLEYYMTTTNTPS